MVYVAPGTYLIYKPDDERFHGCPRYTANPAYGEVLQLPRVSIIGDPHCEVFTDYEPGKVILTTILPGEERSASYSKLAGYLTKPARGPVFMWRMTVGGGSQFKSIVFDQTPATLWADGDCLFEDCEFIGFRRFREYSVTYKRCDFVATTRGWDVNDNASAWRFLGCRFEASQIRAKFYKDASLDMIGCTFDKLIQGSIKGYALFAEGRATSAGTGLFTARVLSCHFSEIPSGMWIKEDTYYSRSTGTLYLYVDLTVANCYFDRVTIPWTLLPNASSLYNFTCYGNRYNMICGTNIRDLLDPTAAIGPTDKPPVGWGQLDVDGTRCLYLAAPISIRREIPVPCFPSYPAHVTVTVQKTTTGWDALIYFGKSKAILQDTLAPQTFELEASVTAPKVVPLEFVCDTDEYDTDRGLIVKSLKIAA